MQLGHRGLKCTTEPKEGCEETQIPGFPAKTGEQLSETERCRCAGSSKPPWRGRANRVCRKRRDRPERSVVESHPFCARFESRRNTLCSRRNHDDAGGALGCHDRHWLGGLESRSRLY